MAERLNNTIETQINDGNTIVSQIVDNNQPLQTVIQDVPQVQTVLQNGINVSSQINAPFVEVTSVNGKTGDVITEPVVGVFEPNHYYLENTMIAHNNNLYYAKETFTSGSSFNANDWYSVEGSQITVDSALSTTSENPVQNKVITTKINEIDRYYRSLVPVGTAITAEGTDLNTITYLKVGKYYCSLDRTVQTFVNCPTTNAFMMEVFSPLSTTIDNETTSRWVYRLRIMTTYFGAMFIQKVSSGATAGSFTYGNWEEFAKGTINNGTLTIQKNGTNVATFTANQSGNATANISVPTKTSDITNDSGFITEIPTASASTLGGIKVGDGLDITPKGTLSTQLGFTTESTSENTKIIRLQDGTTTSYPITTKEAVLGLGDDKFDASFLYDCTLDSTAFTQEQAEALKDAILADKEILIYEVNQSTNKGQYKPYYVSASEDSAFKTINVQYINQAPAQVLFSFMSINGADWTLTVRTTPL